MATFTAQILVGDPHPNDDGITPSHYLFFSENDSCAWVLVPENVFRHNLKYKTILWLPTIENTLEDAFLMIAVHVQKSKEVIRLAKSFVPGIETQPRFEVYHYLNDSQLRELYGMCREATDYPKLILSVFSGSHIRRQLGIVLRYRMDIEVLYPHYSRLFSPWSGRTHVEGAPDQHPFLR